jgi:hypothetical protein
MRMNKSNRMRKVAYVALIGKMRNECKILILMPGGRD